MKQSERYRLMLSDQIHSAGQWLIDNCDKIVSKVDGITDFQISINLKNGECLPTITVEQQNLFWKLNDVACEERKTK